MDILYFYHIFLLKRNMVQEMGHCFHNENIYKSFEKGYNIKIRIINKKYNCILNQDIIYLNNGLPILKSFNCKIDNSLDNSSLFIIDIPFDFSKRNEKNDNYTSNQFIISKIYLDKINILKLFLDLGVKIK